MTFQVGDVLHGRYRIEAFLREGGMGAVYRAVDLLFDQPCAVKEFRLGYLPAEDETRLRVEGDQTQFHSRKKLTTDTRQKASEQFFLEAKLLAKLDHPNLPKVSHFFSERDDHYLVMNLIEGRDLDAVLEESNGKPLPEVRVMGWMKQVMAALRYCHEHGVIHRDVKPGNVIVTEEEKAYLVDFGIAKLNDTSGKTTMGARATTSGYSPYEQYGEGHTDARSDIYSLGATLYALLTGREPIDAIKRLQGEKMPSIRSMNKDVSVLVNEAVRRAMSIHSADRFQSIAEMQAGFTKPSEEISVRPGKNDISAPAVLRPSSGDTLPALGDMHPSSPIRVLVVDDVMETRANIRKLLDNEPDMQVVGAARTGREAIQLYSELMPDVMTTCINMPEMDGIAATIAICKQHPGARVIILSVQGDQNYMRRALLAGACDYLTKPCVPDELLTSIRQAARSRRPDTSAPAVIRAKPGDTLPALGDLRPASSPRISSQKGLTSIKYAVALTPDGARFVSGSSDKTIKVWDMRSSRLLYSLEGHTGQVFAVAITPDGAHVVSGSFDKTLRVWDLQSGSLFRSLEGHTAGVYAVAVTPDGARVISGSADKTIKVWDLQSGHLLHSMDTEWVHAVAISPDAARVVSGSADKTIKVWDLQNSRLLHSLEGHAGGVIAVAITPDGAQVVSGALKDTTLKVWDLQSGSLLRSLKGHTAGIYAVAVTPDCAKVVSGSFKDNTLKVWDLQSGHLLRSLEGHSDGVYAMAITPDGTHVISGSNDDSLKVWDL